MRSVILSVPSSPSLPPPLPEPQSGWTTALSATARPLLLSEWRLNIPRNQSSLAFWTHSQRPSAFHMLMPMFFISFVTMVRQWYRAKGWWIKLVNLFFFPQPPPLFLSLSSFLPSLPHPSLPLLSPSIRASPHSIPLLQGFKKAQMVSPDLLFIIVSKALSGKCSSTTGWRILFVSIDEPR